MKPKIFSGLVLYGYMEVSIFGIYGRFPLSSLGEVHFVSGVSILFRLLRSSIGVHQLFGLGTKNIWLKIPRDFLFLTSFIVFLFIR